MWHQNVPRKPILLKCLGQNIFIQVRTTELCALTTTCFTKTCEYRGAHFTEGKARACRGEGFAAQMEPEENREVAPVPCVLSHNCSNAITNVLPSSLDQKGEWQDNEVRHWKNAYSPKHLVWTLYGVQELVQPTLTPGEWMTLGAWSHVHQCKTEITEKHIKSGYWTRLVNVPAPCISLHDLTVPVAAQTGAQPEPSKALKSFAAWTALEAEQDHTEPRTTTDWQKGWGTTVIFHSVLSKTQLNWSTSMETVKNDNNKYI